MAAEGDEQCLFCRIVSGGIPAKRLYEDDAVIAIRDINPVAPTHLLLITRRHIPSPAALTSRDREVAAALLLAASAVAGQLGLERGYRLVGNSGPDAGQLVQHIHLHLLAGRTLGWPPG